MPDPMPGLTIKVVSERTGIPVHTLRAWERRYGVPTPKRGSENRYRLYDDHDIADVLWLKRQVDSGVSPSQASAVLRHERRPLAALPEEHVQPIATARAALEDALFRSDQAAAGQALDEAFALFAPEQVALAIIEPTMQEIGDRWMRTEMTVWQEHLASSVIEQKLAAILHAQPALPAAAPSLIAACAPNEEHALGLLIFALMARRQGWRVAFLGQATPLADLLDLALRAKPDAMAISVTTVTGLAGLIPWLRPVQRPPTALAFGGRIVNQLPTLRAHLPGEYLGVDAFGASRSLISTKFSRTYWSPSAQAWKAVEALSAVRLQVAGDAVSQFMDSLPSQPKSWSHANLEQATLFLVDALLTALAFDVPAMMELQRQWLEDALPPRLVPRELLHHHFDIVQGVLEDLLSKEPNRHFQPLLDRMREIPAK